ncbi:MAG: amidohydrolase [Gammaproteobacteria bacterium]|jgi:aminobenzoyl-glutamate utilization protein B|nr:amidohydrolase [Gammaproteobacteria bacterium]NDB15635.1 amidohydrolase [Gammaproteobacteria bacterium]NDE86454.1 amidohydrolase [Gammaproteobacteria bacterium]
MISKLHSCLFVLLGTCALAVSSAAAAADDPLLRFVESRRAIDRSVALEIWNWAEVGYQEEQTSARLQKELRDAGFSIRAGVADMPTAFVAEYGSGKPVIAILAEMDALPGVSQAAVPERSPLRGRISGHACGHHLFGTGSTSAGIAVKNWLLANKRPGTIRVYGTPAEEGGAGKAYMVRAGLFDDVDIALHWHAGDRNVVTNEPSLANKSAKFRFTGVAAHAAGAPDRGRSALDGVEAMNYMANMMREHMPDDARLHYIITRGGDAPNVVPEFAEVYYYVRHRNPMVMAELFDRLVRISEAAAMGTGTSVKHEVIHGAYSLLPNDSLAALVDEKLRKVGGVQWDASEQAFAAKISTTFAKADLGPGSERDVQPIGSRMSFGSTDVGDVSWTVPTIGFRTATWVPGTPGHSWQAVAAGGMSIGLKGMENASKVLALTAVDLLSRPELISAARAEFERRRGPDYRYASAVGDRAPPLDYRR